MIAITRHLSPAIARCELTHLERTPIDFDRACDQHAAYRDALRSLGCEVIELPAEPDLPDSVFVEDAAIVLDELAVLMRPGAASRRGEVDSIEPALAPHRTLARIKPPATIDGGDVLIAGRRIFVGMSTRSDPDAVEQLRGIVEPHGYLVETAPVHGCLHLKSAVTTLDDHTLLINRNWTDAACFDGFQLIDVDPAEPHCANVIAVNGTILAPVHGQRTMSVLRERGYEVAPVASDELAKAEGGLTCCSLLLPSST